jgi:hypothetical protein
MILAFATSIVLDRLKDASDISHFSTCLPAWYWVKFYVIIEVYNKRGGGVCQVGEIEVESILQEIQCSRKFVRFIHKRNFCICLERAYNELKTTTQ